MFEAVDQNPDFPALDREVLGRWRERQVFRQVLDANANGPVFRFYDGPPTANGRPGVHHVAARVFKDALPRYRTMKGYRVPRRAGWDCHGIPVELEVERELGFTGKGDIEKYGVARFNDRCRASVTRYVAEFEDLTHRIGYWVDTDEAYWTMSAEYVDSVWWSLKSLYDRGLVYEDSRVVPYCPRCGTTLSDHEVAQGYRDVEDLSVFVRLPLLDARIAGSPPEGGPEVSLLVWTTMPWTFISTTAAVVGEGIRYVLARGGRAGDHLVILAADLLEAALGSDAEIVRDIQLDEIVGARYRGPFDYVGPGSRSDPDGDPAAWRVVVVGDFVTTDQGSGIVSTGAAFGMDDMRVARENGLPVVNPVSGEGRFDDRCGRYAGMDVRAADPLIVEDLRSAGLLVHAHNYRHNYPHCWRCTTPLLYYAKPAWYIATTTHKGQMLAGNDAVDWRPEHIKDGRYGDWLKNNVDWALSRERYWGTPLPLWRCSGCAQTVVVGSRAELGQLAGTDMSTLDPHRPFVDEIVFPCSGCGAAMHRLPEVIDAWYDSGAMPFAQFGYPHRPGSAERFAELFPADYLCEGIDQTRGWFYSLQAISTLLFDRNSYLRAICLGHIVDAAGRKMSKSAGNVVDPWLIVDTYGADALRWTLLVEGNPSQPRRIGDEALRDVSRRVLLTLWNTYYFFVTYARLEGWTPGSPAPHRAARPIMDRYILAELDDVIATVDRALDDFDVPKAGRRIGTFVDDLSNWYVRRCRTRFWSATAGDPGDTGAAFATLHRCLTTLSHLLAPITPFIAEQMYSNLVRTIDPAAPESVHLARFPEPSETSPDSVLRRAMADARTLVRLGRDARRAAGIPVRQPLRRALVTVPEHHRDRFEAIREVVADELNVRSLELVEPDDGQLIVRTLKPNFRSLGAEFGRMTPKIAEAIASADAAEVVAELQRHGKITLDLDGTPLLLDEAHLMVGSQIVAGWHLSADGQHSVALDITIDDELRGVGLAREFTRVLNDLRRRADLARSDRVLVRLRIVVDTAGELRRVIGQHGDSIAASVLAEDLSVDDTHAESDSNPADWVAVEVGSGQVLVSLVTHAVTAET